MTSIDQGRYTFGPNSCADMQRQHMEGVTSFLHSFSWRVEARALECLPKPCLGTRKTARETAAEIQFVSSIGTDESIL